MNLRNASDPEPGSVDPARKGPNARLRELDLKSLPYVPLPRAPLRWEEARSKGAREIPEAQDTFEVRDAWWRLTMVEKLPPAERPDPAFRRLYPVESGLLIIDDLGKAKGLGPIEAAALRYDRDGRLAAKAGLARGIYRLGVHPLGHGLVAMSSDCIVHAYHENLQPLFETALADAPEIQALCRRFDICEEGLKNHIRCVALSRDHQRYLFTAVDEAWCIGRQGQRIWGIKLPMQEGWQRLASPHERCGSSAEIASALALMKLSLPLTPEQLKRRYRELALRWHPDHNHGHPQAQEQMKALNAAVELLTGVDWTILTEPEETEPDQAIFVRAEDRRELDLGGSKGTVMVGVGELFACDWIYAADFAAHSNSVYLAGYSGRVVMADSVGEGLRVYDIGNPPKRIADTGEYLYILTHTRLYVLRDDSLHGLIDTLDSGELVLAKSGFGLLEKKRFRWFSKDGGYLGSVLSKDPIRRVYCSADALVVETRQRRAAISGAPPWWE
jgi:DnaJ domain